MNRGSFDALCEAVGMDRGFNEAPIHESGKCASVQRLRAGGKRFNEAPIHESGKCGRTRGCPGSRRALQ